MGFGAAAARLLRAPVLLGAGVFALHRLRFELFPLEAHGHGHEEAGHAYLSPLGRWLLLALLLAFAGFALALWRAWRTGSSEPSPRSFRWLWPRCTVVLQAAFLGQELLEGWLSADRAAGLGAVVGGGGWSALLFAVLLGAVIALLLRRAAELVRALAGRRLPAPASRCTAIAVRPSSAEWRRRDPVADFLVGRGPPLGGLPAA